MRHLQASLDRLWAKDRPPVPEGDAYARLSGQLETGHTVVLRSVLEVLAAEDQEILPSQPEALASFRLRLEATRADLESRLQHVREDLPHRLSFEVMGTQLMQAEWLREIAPGVWKLPGKGTKREARAVYHVVYHALEAECERYIVQAHSRVEHLQDNLARHWHELPLPGNRARILPLLEEGTRESFLKRMNLWRSRIPAVTEQAFCERILPWDSLEGRSAEELFAGLGAPWERMESPGAGLLGYGLDIIDFCQALLETLLRACDRRWSLFLLGEGFLQKKLSERES